MERTMVLVAALVIQACLGGVYAWSAFVPNLKDAYGLTTADTQLIFGVQIAVFTLSMVFAGRQLERRGPRAILVLSGLLFAGGYGIAAGSGGDFHLLLLGVGVVAGTAIGFGYVCPLATCIKWFPERKGFITGVAVAGFGGGAVVMASIAETGFGHGADALAIFRWVGIGYGLLILLSSLFMKFPPSEKTAAATVVESTGLGLARDLSFWALFAGMFCGTFAGLLVIGNLKPLALAGGISPAWAATGISVFAVGNAVGRVAWGRIVDSLGQKAILPSLLGLALALAFLVPASHVAELFVVASALVGFGFGACFVIYAVLVAARYGAHRVADVYPLVFLAYGLAGITGPTVGGWLFDLTDTYGASIGTSVAVVGLGMAAVFFLGGRGRKGLGLEAEPEKV